MNVGVIGWGKLGGVIGVAIAHQGHKVYGWDVNPTRMDGSISWPFQEEGYDGLRFEQMRACDDIWTTGPPGIVSTCEIVFVVVQTPHEPRFEGTTPLPDERADFDYSHLERAVGDLAAECLRQKTRRTVAVVSTVLPGTIRERIFPLCNHYVDLVYNPAFSAMGTVVRDFLEPEFVLVGTRVEGADGGLCAFYRTITNAPQVVCSYESAEATKVLYNTYITSKIVYANAAMEVCHKVGANVDDVSDALALGTRRIASPAYMRGGMGDGGSCHPRDLIAMSWLARELRLSYDIFGTMASAREEQARWLCGIVTRLAREHGLRPFVLGTAFKAGSNIETGSAALLCKHILEAEWNEVRTWDPMVDVFGGAAIGGPHVYLIGCNHPDLKSTKFALGSVVVDPWRMIPDQEGVTVLRVGE